MNAKSLLDDVLFCVVFFTRLPIPQRNFAGRKLADAIWAAPVAGLAVGLVGAIVYAIAVKLGVPATVAAALTVAALMLCAGGLHEDGLSDTADGFGGGKTRERKLEIMRDSRIGTYGAAAVVLSILLRWSALAEIADHTYVLAALLAAEAGSRAIVPAFMQLTPAARTDGLAADAGTVSPETALAAGAIGFVALLALGPLGAMVAAFFLVLAFVAFRWLCLSQISGQTGDTIGAMQQVGEITILVTAAALLS